MKISTTIVAFVFTLLSCQWRADNNTEPTSQPHDTSEINTGFESEAREYESEDRVIWQKPDLVIDQLGNVEGKVVADLGAGTGYFSRRIAYKGATVIAIDIDPQAIQWMEEQKRRFPSELRDRLIIRQAQPDDPQLRNREVDIILLVNTYSYIDNRVAYFSKLQDAIRPGGSIVIIDFKKKETPFGPPIEDRLDVADVEAELRKAGYEIARIDVESLDYQYIIKARKS